MGRAKPGDGLETKVARGEDVKVGIGLVWLAGGVFGRELEIDGEDVLAELSEPCEDCWRRAIGFAGATGGREDASSEDPNLPDAPVDSVRILGESERAEGAVCMGFAGEDVVLSLDRSLLQGFTTSSFTTDLSLSFASSSLCEAFAIPGIATPLVPKIGCGAVLISAIDRCSNSVGSCASCWGACLLSFGPVARPPMKDASETDDPPPPPTDTTGGTYTFCSPMSLRRASDWFFCLSTTALVLVLVRKSGECESRRGTGLLLPTKDTRGGGESRQ